MHPRAILFRTADGEEHRLTFAPVSLTVAVDRNERTLPLQEYQILRALAAQAGETVPRQRLLQCLWGGGAAFNSRIVDLYVCRLRKLLPLLPIYTVFGVGYALAGRPEEEG